MQPGFIETATVSETTERKEFWNDQLIKAGLNDKYEAVARQMPGIPANMYYGIFVEEKGSSNGQPSQC